MDWTAVTPYWKEADMNKTKFFIFMLLTACCLVFFGTTLADQDGNKRWCNSDQYGCWITDDDGGQSYIMFWSESARDLFMGPDSKAPVVKQYPAGQMPLDPAPMPAPKELTQKEKLDAIFSYFLKNGLPINGVVVIPTVKDCIDIAKLLEEHVENFSAVVNTVYDMVSSDPNGQELFNYLNQCMQ